MTAIVLGAGATGLAAGLELRDRGVPVEVLEEAGRPGGKLASRRVASQGAHGSPAAQGYLIETGALGLLDREGDLAPLAERLGLRLLPAHAGARWVQRDGQVHQLPMSPPALIGSGLFSVSEKLGLLREPWRRRSSAPSVRDFFEARLGPAGTFLADALQTGIYAGDPAQLELASCFPQLARLEASHGSLLRGLLAGRKEQRKKLAGRNQQRKPRATLSSFPGGLEDLVQGLAQALGPALRLGARVLSVQPGLRLQLEDGGIRSEVTARSLLVTLPAPAAAQVLEPLDPVLAARLRELTAAPLTLVHLGAASVGPRARSFGLLSPGRPVAGTLFPAALWPGRAPEGRTLITALVGGARAPEAAALPDPELVDLVRTELSRTIGLTGPTELLGIVRWQEAIPQYTLGHAARVAEIDRLTALHPGLKLAGSWLRGVSVLDCLREGRRIGRESAEAFKSC